MKIKTTALAIFTAIITLPVFAQEAEPQNTAIEEKFWQKEKLFTGGAVNLSFFGGTTVLGVIPHFGYSLTPFMDVAASLNVNYISQRDYNVPNDRVRQTTIGPGAFVRLFPVRFIFAQAQYEHNFMRLKYIPAPNSGYVSERLNINSNSFLVGGGYATGREKGQNTFGYFSIMWDIGNDKNSPYKDNLNRAIPIIRGGINISLFQGRNMRRF